MSRFAVIGMGLFGQTLVKKLVQEGAEVIAVDQDRKQVESVKEWADLAVTLDSTDEEALRNQGLGEVDAAVICIGENFESNQLTTIMLKRIGVKRVVARATTKIRAQILSQIGADEIINPEEETAARWANLLVNPNIVDAFELGEDHSLVEFPAPKKLIGTAIKDMNIRERFRLNIVAVKKRFPVTKADGVKEEIHKIVAIPKPDDIVEEGDVLIVVGQNTDIEKFTSE